MIIKSRLATAVHNAGRMTTGALVFYLVSLPVQAQVAAPPAGSAAPGQLEEVVVTASKREERLIDVPSGIALLSSETIQNQGLSSFADYVGLIPNFNQRDNGAPGYGTVIIRGLNSGPQQTSNTTSYYLDEVVFSSSASFGVGALSTPDADIFDLERLEVLKGPQGTLYGASTLGGLVRLISKKPDLETVGGSLRLDGRTIDGGSDGSTVRGTFNYPVLENRLALRVSGFTRQEPGFVDNVGTGTDNVNEGDSWGVRGSALWQINDDASLELVGMKQEINMDGPAREAVYAGTTDPVYGKNQYSAFYDENIDSEYQLFSGTLNWDLQYGQLTAVASYGETELKADGDVTDAYGAFVASFFPPGFGLPAVFRPKMEKDTAEVRFASDRLGDFEFLLGGLYTKEKNRYIAGIDSVFQSTGEPLPPPFDNFIDTLTASDYDEWGVFGNLTYYIRDNIDITGGVRYAANDEKVAVSRSGVLADFMDVTDKFDFDDNATTYLATARWRPSDDVSTYLRAASGYRPGGPQTNPVLPDAPPFDPDKVWNYEAGLKAALLDGRLSVNSAVYYIEWTDIQLNTLAGGFLLTGNGGEAEIYGAELGLQWVPLEGLVLQLNGGYNDTEITSIDADTSASIGAQKGDELPLNAKWNGSLVADYSLPLGQNLVAAAGATVRYQDDRNSSYPNAVLNPNVVLPSYTTLDLRLGVTFRENYNLQFRVENATDEHDFSSLTTNWVIPGQGIPGYATPIRPRTYVLSLGMNF